MNLHTYTKLDATDIAELIKKKEVTPREILKLSFAQMEKVNPDLNAVVHHRMDKVLEEAENFSNNGPFAGVPILLKNISQSLKGEPITSGSSLFESAIANRNSYFVDKILKTGFLVTGHTNTPEFGLKNITEPRIYGPSRNPWNTDYSPGGSSGGAAAAIASGIVPLAGASDGGGSIRIPASFTSLVGLKPTRGRTAVGPGAGRQWQGASIDFVLSKTVRDSAAMLDALQVIQQSAAFHTPLLSGSSLDILGKPFTKPLKVAFSTASPVGTPVSDDAKQAVSKIVKWLESEGYVVEERDNGVDGVQLMRNYYLMNSGEISGLVEQVEQAIGRPVSEKDLEIESWLLNEAGKSVTAAQYSASLASWDNAAAQMADLHEEYDLYITPTNANTAPKIGELTHTAENEENLRERMKKAVTSAEKQEIIYEMFLPSLTYTPFTQLANLTGQPAISVPVHLSAAGLPLGVQFMAAKGQERLLLQLASQIEQTNLWVGLEEIPYYKIFK